MKVIERLVPTRRRGLTIVVSRTGGALDDALV